MKGKVVVITGASSGLGNSLAKKLSKEDCIVYGLSRNIEKIDLINSQNFKTFPLDVTNPELVEQTFQKIFNEQGKIDTLINNSGWEKVADIYEITKDLLYKITEVNYYGIVYCTKEVIKYMKEGDIVQILSTSSETPRQNEPAYCAAKSAALMFSNSIKPSLAKNKIRLINILPGAMKTPFSEKAGLSLPENAMNPDDVAEVIINALKQPRNITQDIKILRQNQF